MFIRKQLAPYRIECKVQVQFEGLRFEGTRWEPSIRYESPLPQYVNSYDGSPSSHGLDVYGYTDFDDYHLALYGA